MFWSLIIQPGKKYSSTVKDTFHLSMAALDSQSVQRHDNGVYPVKVEISGEELILCNLSNQCLQVSLDLQFEKGSKITFLTTGKATVHLTGYTLLDDLEDDMFSESESNSEESNEIEDPGDSLKKLISKTNSKGNKELLSEKKSPEKRKLESLKMALTKKPKLLEKNSSDDEDNSESGDEYDDSDLSGMSISDIGEDDENDSDDVDEEDDDEDGSDDSLNASDDDSVESFTDFASAKKKKNLEATPKSNKKSLTQDKKTPSQDKKTPSQDKKTPSQDKKTPSQNKKTPIQDKKSNKTPLNNMKPENKSAKLNMSMPNGVSPKSEKKDKKKNLSKGEPNTPKGNESAPNTPPLQKKQTLEGGVTVEELKGGNGPSAKPGKLVTVYYTGRLKNNNRVFDQSNSGPGFKFRLGKGEVIKGWDVALNGMKVGSKRRITCPPAMAYGPRGSPPTIPPNSALVFDVELRSVN